jgi:hypothetical protein
VSGEKFIYSFAVKFMAIFVSLYDTLCNRNMSIQLSRAPEELHADHVHDFLLLLTPKIKLEKFRWEVAKKLREEIFLALKNVFFLLAQLLVVC